MSSFSAISNVKAKAQQVNATEAFLKSGSQTQEQYANSLFDNGTNRYLLNQKGFDFTHVPARPGLRTTSRIQCCAKTGSLCSCPECSQKQNEIGGSWDEEKFGQSLADSQPTELSVPPSLEAEEGGISEQSEQHSSVPDESPAVESAALDAKETSALGLLVEDSAPDMVEGQMRKTQFLQRLRTEICNTIGPVLATVGQTTEDCPYLNYWLDLYQEKDATHIERTAKKYAPEINDAKRAEEYISVIAQRALRAALIWTTTGKITGVPEGIPATLPNETASQKENKEAGQNVVQAKSKKGSAKNANDPRAIHKELGNGQPLASDVRSRMESAFGVSFSNVRTHTDSIATGLSNRLNARAFTVGNHVTFGNGEFKPGTLIGDALIAHELAHTIQQTGKGHSVSKMEIGEPGYTELERDADRASISALTSIYRNTKGALSFTNNIVPRLKSGLSLQRCSKDKKETCSGTKKTIAVDLIKFPGSNKTPSSDLAYANTIYDKCCINFTVGQDKPVPEDLSEKSIGKDRDANFSGITCAHAPPEEVSMYDGPTKKYGLSSRMRAFYVEKFSGYAAGGFSRPPYCADGNSSPYVNHIVLQNTAPKSGLAHELGHILLNNGEHADATESKNLMGTSGGSELDDKRCKDMYTNA